MPTDKRLAEYGLLFLAWIVWFYLLTFLTQLTFTPWDGAIDWSQTGTWQRTLNDFFAGDPGRLIISIPFILVCVWRTRVALSRNPALLRPLLGRAWLFVPVLLLAWLVSVLLNNALHPYPPVMYDASYRGFHLSILPGAALVGTCAIWLCCQWRNTNRLTGTALQR